MLNNLCNSVFVCFSDMYCGDMQIYLLDIKHHGQVV